MLWSLLRRLPHNLQRLRSKFGFAFDTGAALTLVCEAALAGGPSLEVVSSWGGPVNAVQVEGDLAYVAVGRRLVALNVADPSNMTELGSIDMLAAAADVVVRNGLAYVSTSTRFDPGYGFCIVDIANPAAMFVVDHYINSFNSPGRIHLRGNLAFVERPGGGNIPVYDVSDPRNLILVGEGVPGGNRFAISGDLLYDVRCWCGDPTSGARLRIYDLAIDPVNPPLLGTCTIPLAVDVSPRSLFVDGDYAYITHDANDGTDQPALVVVDVNDPGAPTLVTSFPGWVHPNDVVVVNGFAYVADYAEGSGNGISHSTWQQSKGLVILDVSNPGRPVQVSTFKTHGTIRGVRVFGNRAYAFDDGEGLIVLDVSNPAAPVRLGNYHSPALLRKMHKEDDLLYAADAWNGFTILDVSNPQATPAVVGVYQTPPEGFDNRSVDVRDGVAYLSEGDTGFEAINVSDPSNPTFVGAFTPWPVGIHCASLKLNPIAEILHVAVQNGNLVNFSVSDLQNIGDVGFVQLCVAAAIDPYDIEVTPDGDMCHVASECGFQIIDVANPAVPVLIHTQPSTTPRDVALKSGLRFTADISNTAPFRGIHVQDMQNPANPVDLSYINFTGGSATVDASNQYVYSMGITQPTGFQPRVLMYDMSNPAQPVVQSSVVVWAAHSTASLLAAEPFLYVATGDLSSGDLVVDQGLIVIKIDGLPLPCLADINGNGTVNIDDLLAVISAWGPCVGCAADINQNGLVNIDDLLAVISAWGACR
jgi:hypothetical protein